MPAEPIRKLSTVPSVNRPFAPRTRYSRVQISALGSSRSRGRAGGSEQAQGNGVERDNACGPNCAAGKFVTKNVHLTLDGLVRPGNIFTRVTTVDADGHARTWPMTAR